MNKLWAVLGELPPSLTDMAEVTGMAGVAQVWLSLVRSSPRLEVDGTVASTLVIPIDLNTPGGKQRKRATGDRKTWPALHM